MHTTPVATSRVHDILIVAHRLGMRWQEFDPYKGRMFAEDYGHLITSSNIEGGGVLLKYEFVGTSFWQDECFYIPTETCDRLRYGIITALAESGARSKDQLFLLGDDGLPSQLIVYIGAEVIGACKGFEELESREGLKGLGSDTLDYQCAVNEWISLVCEPLHVADVEQQAIVWPVAMKKTFSTFDLPLSQRVFRARFRETTANRDSEQANAHDHAIVRSPFEYLVRQPSELFDVVLKDKQGTPDWTVIDRWTPEQFEKKEREDRQLKKECHRSYEETTVAINKYFATESSKTQFYDHLEKLRGAYVTVAIEAVEPVRQAVKDRSARKTEDYMEGVWDINLSTGDKLFMSELAHHYVDDLPKFVNYCKSLDFVTSQSVRDAWKADMALQERHLMELWWLLILRGIAWCASVDIDQRRDSFPSEYYSSQMPVYIA